ncbi:MAG: hypothetical protein COB24_05225 [Hyphomicrobiales bacterium]|nr:MAG: hypothetical protein COB24_05225 [Hyphomicrobiales bacterium]
MSFLVFCAVVLAAMLHAAWNAVAKSQSDKLLTMTALVFGSAFWGALVLPITSAPHPQSYMYIVISIALHVGYQIVLQAAYKLGDLSLIYPISRGTAPLIVTLFSVFVWQIGFELVTILGVVAIILAVFCLGFTKNGAGGRDSKAVAFALMTACFIAAYSLVDGTGARLSGDPFGYYAWLTIANALFFIPYVWMKKPVLIVRAFQQQKTIMFFGGFASFAAYAIVMWAFTQAPIAMVTALRESSIMFAMMIGVFFFKEKFGRLKFAATLLTLLGMVLLRL